MEEEQEKEGEGAGGGGKGGVGEVKTLTNVSLQSAAMSISRVLDQVPMRTEISREETSALGTIVLETVESAMLATLLTPSGNVSQTIQTENLGTA